MLKLSLVEIMRALYASEINVSISCVWAGGWEVALGDSVNGCKAEETFDNDRLQDVAAWFLDQAKVHYPASMFAKLR